LSVHQKKDGRWFVSYRDEAKRQHIKVFGKGSQCKKEAEAFDYQLKSDSKLGKKPRASSQLYFDELAQHYIDHKRAFGASKSYVYELKNLLNNHVLPLLPNRPVDQLKYADMQAVADAYRERSQSTRNRYFTYLKAIFRFGIKMKLTSNNPLEGWIKSKEPRRKSALTVEDLRKIIEHADPHLQWALEVSWNLGTRPGRSELLNLKWQDFDPEGRSVRVFASKTKTWREVPISEDFAARMAARKSDAASEFVVEYKGKPIRKFRRSFQTACQRAGLGYHCIMYDVRHLFATIMLRGGADLAAVSSLLGHSSTHMTANTYYHLMAGEKTKAVSLLPSLHDVIGDGQSPARQPR
jgi:integrase